MDLELTRELQRGDEVEFEGIRYVLLWPEFPGAWAASEINKPNSKPRLLASADWAAIRKLERPAEEKRKVS